MANKISGSWADMTEETDGTQKLVDFHLNELTLVNEGIGKLMEKKKMIEETLSLLGVIETLDKKESPYAKAVKNDPPNVVVEMPTLVSSVKKVEKKKTGCIFCKKTLFESEKTPCDECMGLCKQCVGEDHGDKDVWLKNLEKNWVFCHACRSAHKKRTEEQ
jgi:hypothetical protein